jgi:crossover junction endodeoxyribonuclease RuvC
VGVSLQQFEQMKARVAGKIPAPLPMFESRTVLAKTAQQIILGVDPSLRGTGYGVIRAVKSQPQTLAHGTISCPSTWPRSRCLAKIAETLRGVIKDHQPTLCIIEGLFYAQNLQTALIMGEARGAALAVIGEAGIEIHEIAARKVKQSIVGYGAAQKIAVAKMVQRMLKLAELPSPDAADALALALAHSQQNGRYTLIAPKRI